MIWIGWRIALMPTLSMASLRESGVAWTSGMCCRSRAFMGVDFNIRVNYSGYYALGSTFWMPAASSPTEASSLAGSPWSMKRSGRPSSSTRFSIAVGERLAHRAAGAAHDLVLFDGDEQLVVRRELVDQLDVQRLHEAHVGHRRVERLGRLQRRLQHRAEREDRDLAPACGAISPLPTGSAFISSDRDAGRRAARIAHRRRAARA